MTPFSGARRTCGTTNTRRVIINVVGAWESGAYGEGINVNVVDTGVNPEHSDLKGVVDEARSGSNLEGMPIFDSGVNHGTEMAGIIAAQHNDIGMRGIAPEATVFSYRPRSFLSVAGAFKHEHESVAVSNNSWAQLRNGGDTPIANRLVVEEGVIKGITDGFHGKGTLYVFGAAITENSRSLEH